MSGYTRENQIPYSKNVTFLGVQRANRKSQKLPPLVETEIVETLSSVSSLLGYSELIIFPIELLSDSTLFGA